MQFTLKTTQGLERRIEVAIPHTRVAGEVDRRLRDLSRTANIRGFRKGKVCRCRSSSSSSAARCTATRSAS